MPFNGSTQTINTRAAREARQDEELEQELAQRAKAQEPEEVTQPEESKAKGWEKRHNDMKSFMQKQLNEQMAEVKKLREQLADAAKQQIKFPKTEEEVEEWIGKYPDVAAIVKTIAMKEVANVRKEVEDRDAEIQKRAYQVEFDRCINKITHQFPDFWDLRENEDFVDWVSTQPKKIRSAFDPELELDELEDAADTVIYAIKLFKMETAPAEKPKPKVDNSREAARQVVNRNNGATPKEKPDNHILLSEIEKMGIREYEKREDEIRKAYAEGRIIDDINGAAR